MYTALIILASILIAVLVVLALIYYIIKFNIRIDYGDDLIIVYLQFLGKFRKIYAFSIKQDKSTDKPAPDLKTVLGIISKAKKIYEMEKNNAAIVGKIIQKNADIYNYNIDVFFGFGNAAITGIATAPIHSALNWMHKLICDAICLHNVGKMLTFPIYNQKAFNCKASVSVKFRIFRANKAYKEIKIIYDIEYEKVKTLFRNTKGE